MASDWIVLWIMHHLTIPFCSRNSERMVVPVVLLEVLLLLILLLVTTTTTTAIIKMAQRYVDATVNGMSLLSMGEC